jgi:hypothetical protein
MPHAPRDHVLLQTHLLEAALSLAYDPVANVRLHLAAAMPMLKAALTLPDDVHLLERLNSGMSYLITDGDGDVRREARKVGLCSACLWPACFFHFLPTCLPGCLAACFVPPACLSATCKCEQGRTWQAL